MNIKIKYLKELISLNKNKEINNFMYKLRDLKYVKVLPGYPLEFRQIFLLNQSKRRQINAIKYKLNVVGINELISSLEKFDGDTIFLVYALEIKMANREDSALGDLVVLNEEIVGCRFVINTTNLSDNEGCMNYLKELRAKLGI